MILGVGEGKTGNGVVESHGTRIGLDFIGKLFEDGQKITASGCHESESRYDKLRRSTAMREIGPVGSVHQIMRVSGHNAVSERALKIE